MYIYVDVSENSGTAKSSILIGFSIINHPVWGTPYFRKHPCMYECSMSFNLPVFGMSILFEPSTFGCFVGCVLRMRQQRRPRPQGPNEMGPNHGRWYNCITRLFFGWNLGVGAVNEEVGLQTDSEARTGES